jgi:hypothetical protein
MHPAMPNTFSVTGCTAGNSSYSQSTQCIYPLTASTLLFLPQQLSAACPVWLSDPFGEQIYNPQWLMCGWQYSGPHQLVPHLLTCGFGS